MDQRCSRLGMASAVASARAPQAERSSIKRSSLDQSTAATRGKTSTDSGRKYTAKAVAPARKSPLAGMPWAVSLSRKRVCRHAARKATAAEQAAPGSDATVCPHHKTSGVKIKRRPEAAAAPAG